MATKLEPPQTAVAIAVWKVMYPDPIVVQAGESVIVGATDPEWPGWTWCTDQRGKSGWTPAEYLQPSLETGIAVALHDFTARELNIDIGDTVSLLQFQSGWYWASNAAGQEGWIPASHVAAKGR